MNGALHNVMDVLNGTMHNNELTKPNEIICTFSNNQSQNFRLSNLQTIFKTWDAWMGGDRNE
jgi:hypothetical protein